MGRKSNKVKEKRMKWKEESARIGAKQATVNDADAMVDPMESLAPFKKFNRNGLNLAISCHRVNDMDPETVEWAYELTKANMQTLYEDSHWGWNDIKKHEEMFEDKARYLIARDEAQIPVAVVHYRYDLDNDEEVLYCYEIQLSKPVRRKGLGKFMMQILELLAYKSQMKKVMCTIFNTNDVSKAFFINKLKYEVDETSPSESMEEALYDEDGYTYQILSKKIAPKGKTTADDDAPSSSQHTCCHSHGHGHSHGHSHSHAATNGQTLLTS